MGKVSIKKNVKPKTIKQKQKQTQKTNVTVNIGSISKKRGRPKRQSHIEKKKPTQQPIYQPIVSNQPIFKQTNPQPQSLASSILATQEKPKIVSNEIKQESAITRALVEQNTNTDDPENLVNDLEKTKKKVIIPTPVKPPTITPIPVKPPFITPSQTTETNSIRKALLSQSLNDQGNDTEEIQRIKVSTLPLYPLAAAGRLGIEATSALKMGAGVASSALPYVGAGGVVLGSLGLGVASLAGSGLYSGAKSLLSSRTNEQNPLTGSYQQPPDDETKEELPILEESKDSEPPEPLTQQQPIEQTILQPPELEPTILQQVQPEPEEDYSSFINDLTIPPTLPEEIPPIQTEAKVPKEKKDIKKNPSLLEPSATKSSLTQALQAEEPQASQVLEATRIEESAVREKTPATQVNELWEMLKDEHGGKKTSGPSRYKTVPQKVNDIRKVTGYENYVAPVKTIENTGKTGPSKKKISTTVATPVIGEIPVTTIEVGKPIQPTILEVAKPPPTILEVSKLPSTILQGKKTAEPSFILPPGQESLLDYYENLS